MSILVAN